MKKGLLILMGVWVIFTVSCEDNSPIDDIDPATEDTITNPAEAGQIIQNYYNSNNGLYYFRSMNAFTGTDNYSVQSSTIYGVSAPVIENDILYFTSKSSLSVFNLNTGSRIYEKNFGGVLLNTTYPSNHPVIKDSMIYLVAQGTSNQQIYLFAIKKQTGDILYSVNISAGRSDTSPMLGTPLISGDNIFISYRNMSGSNHYPAVLCLNRLTGNQVWTKSFASSDLISAFLIEHESKILLTSRNASATTNIFALDKLTGNISFQSSVNGSEVEYTEKRKINNNIAIVVIPAGSNVADRNITIFNPATGTEISTFNVGSENYSVEADIVYYIKNDSLFKHSVTSNTTIWKKPTLSASIKAANTNNPNLWTYNSSPLITDKYIYTIEQILTPTPNDHFMNSIVIYNKATGKCVYELRNNNMQMARFIIKNKESQYFVQNIKFGN